MLEALSTPHSRAVTLGFLVVCGFSAIASGVVGISDNPPGILLALFAGAAFVLAFVHGWRTARPFRSLFFGSVLGLVFFGILHNVLGGVAGTWAKTGAVRGAVEGLSVAAFFIAVLGFPPTFLVGGVGWVAMSFRNRRRSGQAV